MSKKFKKEVYEWSQLLDGLKKFSGKDPKDWDDRYKNRIIYTRKDYETGNYPTAIWARDNGYNWEVLGDTYDSNGNRIERSKEEVDLRVKIRKAYNEYLEANNILNPEHVYPQDFDDYMSTEFWSDIPNGSIQYFNPYEILEDIENEGIENEGIENEGIENEDLEDLSFVRDALRELIRFFESENIPKEIEVYVSW